MKKVLLVCALALGVSAASFAQGPPQRTPEERLTQLKTQIAGITDAQSAKLKLVYEAQAKTQDSLMKTMQGGGGDMDAMRANFTKMREANNAKIKAILTAEQQAAFDKLPQRGPGGGGPR
ncbi:hypothetical protein ACFQZS_04820 [Mucilaginibacter calamicampi]|uniref:LTXXQ motif family protein n=1 Tax=Mucilaginibacter calamicampi TaxID=1302352 RepID=A0ABW2YSP7_9SPHI